MVQVSCNIAGCDCGTRPFVHTPKALVTDADFLMEFGDTAIRYFPPYMAKQQDRWAVFEAWKVLRGPNTGACEYEWRWMRWWHPGDLILFVRDRRAMRRRFGGAPSSWNGCKMPERRGQGT